MADKTFEDVLLEKHGALMSVEALAELLDTTPRKVSNGFANNLPWCRPFKPARIKIGRRVFLNTLMVASILLSSQNASAFGLSSSHHAVASGVGIARPRPRGWVRLGSALLYYIFHVGIFASRHCRPHRQAFKPKRGEQSTSRWPIAAAPSLAMR